MVAVPVKMAPVVVKSSPFFAVRYAVIVYSDLSGIDLHVLTIAVKPKNYLVIILLRVRAKFPF